MASSPASADEVEVRNQGQLLHTILNDLERRGGTSRCIYVDHIQRLHGITHDQLFEVVLPRHQDLFVLTHEPHPITGIPELFEVSLRQVLPGVSAEEPVEEGAAQEEQDDRPPLPRRRKKEREQEGVTPKERAALEIVAGARWDPEQIENVRRQLSRGLRGEQPEQEGEQQQQEGVVKQELDEQQEIEQQEVVVKEETAPEEGVRSDEIKKEAVQEGTMPRLRFRRIAASEIVFGAWWDRLRIERARRRLAKDSRGHYLTTTPGDRRGIVGLANPGKRRWKVCCSKCTEESATDGSSRSHVSSSGSMPQGAYTGCDVTRMVTTQRGTGTGSEGPS